MYLADYRSFGVLTQRSLDAKPVIERVSAAFKNQLDALQTYLEAQNIIGEDSTLEDLQIPDPYPAHPKTPRSEKYKAEGLQIDPLTIPMSSSSELTNPTGIGKLDLRIAQYFRYLGRVYESFKTMETAMFDSHGKRDENKEKDYPIYAFAYWARRFATAQGEFYFHFKEYALLGAMQAVVKKVDHCLAEEEIDPYSAAWLATLAGRIESETIEIETHISRACELLDSWYRAASILDCSLCQDEPGYREIYKWLHSRSGALISNSKDIKQCRREKQAVI